MKKTIFFSLLFIFGNIAAGSAQILSLNGIDWKIIDIPNDSIGAFCSNWIPAKVPGNIQADLETARILKPLWYGAGDKRLSGVALKDWWIRKDFVVPMSFEGKRITIIFDGVDYECEVYFNGYRIGRNAGMFRRFWFDLTNSVLPGKSNRLELKISRMPEKLVVPLLEADGNLSGYGGEHFFGYGQHKMLNCLKDLKSTTNWGFDWGVNIWTLGLWRDVSIKATGTARIDWLQVKSVLSNNYRRATIEFRIDIDNLFELEALVDFRIHGNDTEVSRTVKTLLKPGKNIIQTEVIIEEPALWWPNGQGEQPLYQVQARLKRLNGELLDTETDRVGIREIDWGQVEGAPDDFINPFRLIVNGRTVRMMGSNIIPPDLLFGRMNQRGLRLIELAKEAGINTFRLWGGGVTLSKEMYDLADEYGIMIPNEFPLSYMPYPTTDTLFLKNLDQTIRNIVKQVRNHPCIIEWSGGNELQWKQGQQHPVLLTMERAAQEEDQRIFRATCSMQGSRHSPWDYNPKTHNSTYDNPNLKDNNEEMPMMRYGEFGCQSPANLEVWHREIPPSCQWPIVGVDNPILARKNVFQAAFDENYWLRKGIINLYFGQPEDLETMVEAGQFLGAEGLRYAIDALRRRGKRLGGFTTWDYNEPWPNGAGSYMVDYDGRTLMNYDFVRQAIAPVSLNLKYDSLIFEETAGIKAELFICSDATKTVENAGWQWIARDCRGEIFDEGKGNVSTAPLEAAKLANLELKPPEETSHGPVLVEMRLMANNGRLLSERIHVFSSSGSRLGGMLIKRSPDTIVTASMFRKGIYSKLRFTTLKVRASTANIKDNMKEFEVLRLQIQNTGQMTALFCEPHPLIQYRTDLFIDNNHCFIPPGESRTVTIKSEKKSHGGLSLAQTGWRITTWNADDVIIKPSADILLALGREDRMCREFGGYPGLAPSIGEDRIQLTGRQANASKVPFLADDSIILEWAFQGTSLSVSQRALLSIHSSDQATTGAMISIDLNGKPFLTELPEGYGFQKADPAHLAQTKSAEVAIPEGVIRQGENLLRIKVSGPGWFTWDALILRLLVKKN